MGAVRLDAVAERVQPAGRRDGRRAPGRQLRVDQRNPRQHVLRPQTDLLGVLDRGQHRVSGNLRAWPPHCQHVHRALRTTISRGCCPAPVPAVVGQAMNGSAGSVIDFPAPITSM